MDTNIQIFNSDEFGEIRVTELNGEVAFVAADVCRALEIVNVGNVIARLEDDEKGIRIMDTLGGPQKMSVVNEAGLYHLIFLSRKPNALAFKRWVLHDVLPNIRKHGAYISPNAAITPEFLRNLADALEQANRKVAQLEATVAELEPKASYYDLLLNCDGAVTIGVIAQDYNLKAFALNQILQQQGIQYAVGKPGKKYWQLTKASMDEAERRGERWVVTEQHKFKHRDGTDGLANPFMKWTQQGRRYIYNVLSEQGIFPAAATPSEE